MAGSLVTRSKAQLVVILGILAYYAIKQFGVTGDVLNGFSSEMTLSGWQLQAVTLGLCLNPWMVSSIKTGVEKANAKSGYKDGSYEYSFEEHGGVDEDDYDKSSIYSILYSLYSELGETLTTLDGKKERYEFTFNTWGVAEEGEVYPNLEAEKSKSFKEDIVPTLVPDIIPSEDPQKHGKASYSWFIKSPMVREAMARAEKEGRPLKIVEIGCGTGAGANWLSTKVFPNSHYTAIDMQKAAIQTCQKKHGSAKLDCVHLPEGVGNYQGYQPTSNSSSKIVNVDNERSHTSAQNAAKSVSSQQKFTQGQIPLMAQSVDVAIILETHIAEQRIGPEEKAIFQEIKRVLKPDTGLFLWGNALPTNVWLQAEEFLPQIGFEVDQKWNTTKKAVLARDQDQPRVDMVMELIRTKFVAFTHFGSLSKECWSVVDKLIRNFYRDPNTVMYLKMVRGLDSYMHYVFKLSTGAANSV